MKAYITRNIKKISIALLTALMILSAVAFTLSKNNFVLAQNSYTSQAQPFLPKSELEYRELNSPIDVYSDESITAIIERSDQSLTVFKDGKFKKTSLDFTDLHQVKKLDDNNLLVSDGVLYTITLDTLQKEPFTYNNGGTDEPVDATFFDFNGKYLVKVYNTVVVIYKIENSVPVSKSTIENCTKAPVAINENDDIFFVQNNNLCSLSLNAPFMSAPDVLLQDTVPSHMIAKENFVYYILNKNIYKLNILDKTVTNLAVVGDKNYELGNIKTPTSISFNGNNLLITDGEINAIQEFRIDGDNLVFTGFAIAKGKTAFNRISNTAIEIAKYNKTTAILDSDSLLVVNIEDNFNAHDTSNFKDFSYDFLGFNEYDNKDFALGNNTILLSYKHNSSLSELKLLNLKNGQFINEQAVKVFEGNIIRDLCYQSGKYYVLADDGSNNYRIYVSDENQLYFSEHILETDYAVTQITVDVFGNIYLLDEINSRVCKYLATDFNNYTYIAFSGVIKKMSTDLHGTLFALKEQSVLYLDKNGDWQEITVSPSNVSNSANIKSFAMDFITDDVYFIYEDEEFVYKTNTLNNLAISSFSIPDTYVTTDVNADFNNLKLYKPKDTANVYSINKTDNSFEYLELIKERTEYAFIAEIDKTDAFGAELKFYALAGQDGVVLVNANECIPLTVETSSAPEKAFVTTAVHLYYLPISTPNDSYALTDTTKTRLSKNAIITPTQTISFLGNSYYFATATVNGKIVSGYIPVNFTAEVLTENFEWESYITKTISKTDVFSNKELTKLTGVLESQEIKLLEIDGSICKIAYRVNQTDWAVGYINSSAIKDPANVAVRNILIILAVATCLCGTTSYFLLRKKVRI